MSIRFLSLFAAGVFTATVASASSFVGFRELGHEITRLGDMGSEGFVVADVDGDGRDDLVAGNNGAAGQILIYGTTASDPSIHLKQDLTFGAQGLLAIAGIPAPGGGGVVAVLGDGFTDATCVVFQGWPLAETDRFTVAADFSSEATVVDVDGDGELEVLVKTTSGLDIYSLTGHSLERSIPEAWIGFGLQQLDADPALEIAVVFGDLLDGATGAVNWTPPSPFESNMVAGRFGPGGAAQLIDSSTFGRLHAYAGNPVDVVWTNDSGPWASHMVAVDFDNDGRDELLVFDALKPGLSVLDSLTQLERFGIPNTFNEPTALTAIDFDGNGTKEIVQSTSVYGDGGAGQVFDSTTGQEILKWPSFEVDTTATLIADVDGNGRLDLITGLAEVGLVRILDAASGEEQWRPESDSSGFVDPFDFSINSLLTTQADGDAALEIVIAGTRYEDGKIVVMDGATHEVQHVFEPVNYSGPLKGRAIDAAKLVDFDNDGKDDIVSITQDLNPGPAAVRVQVFSLINGTELWASDPIGNEGELVRNVLIGQTDADATPELIAVTDARLQAFDLQTHAVEWTLLSTTADAAYVPNGQSGAELAVVSDAGALTFYDANTRSYLRAFAVDAPVESINTLDGSAKNMILVSGGRLQLVDGLTGETRFVSNDIGPTAHSTQALSFASWNSKTLIATGRGYGINRQILGDLEVLYANDFE